MSGFQARPAEELAPVLAWLRRGEAVRARTAFPAGTALPDGRLDLCKQDLGPLGAAAIAEALPAGGGPVKHLLLGTDGLGDGGAAAVTPKAVAAHVETLYLGCNNIGGGGVCEIANQLIAAPGVVKALWLKRNPVGADGVRAVAETVRAGTVLRRLSVASNGIGSAALGELVAAAAAAGVELVDAGRVKAAAILAADDNHLDELGAATIATALAAAPHRLAFLNLRHTDLGSPGALRLLAGAQGAATPTRFLLGGGIAKRIKKELTALAAEVPASVFDVAPDVRAIRSVYRTAPPA